VTDWAKLAETQQGIVERLQEELKTRNVAGTEETLANALSTQVATLAKMEAHEKGIRSDGT
jgi:hypothetical protein